MGWEGGYCAITNIVLSSSRTVGIFDPWWRVKLETYQGQRYRTMNFLFKDVDAWNHSSMPYVHVGLRMDL